MSKRHYTTVTGGQKLPLCEEWIDFNTRQERATELFKELKKEVASIGKKGKTKKK